MRLRVAPEDGAGSPCSCEATAMATSKPTNMAAPPTVGVGRSWTRRSSGMTMNENRTASRRTTKVQTQVTTAATASDDHVVAVPVDGVLLAHG